MSSWVRMLACAVACSFAVTAWGQTNACSVPPPDTVSSAPNMFDDRQEQDLADAFAEYFESDLRIAPPAENDQLTRIGERLLAALPPSGIHYRFRIYDSGEVNGFSLAGGRVYISRKLIAALHSEDELAGVVAHEIGHLATHQTAIEMTRLFQSIGIRQVGDRADIFARVHQLMNSPLKTGNEKESKRDQLAADHVAVYAMVRAGYDPQSFAAFFDRITENKGKTGNWLTNAFGITKEDTLRYVEAVKLIGTLPSNCRGQHAAEDQAFQAWARNVVQERITEVATGLAKETTVQLQPSLRPAFWRVRFSPDGTMLLGQDEASIVIADRETGSLKLRIDAPGAAGAQFSPDSRRVVFHDPKLRIEQWDIAAAKRISAREVVLFSGCTQTVLSPDGRTLACIKLTDDPPPLHVDVQLVDVDSGNAVYKNPFFYAPGAFEYQQLVDLAEDIIEGYNVANVAVSHDGRYLLLSAGSVSLAFDFTTQKPIALMGKLKGLQQNRMSFVGADRLAVMGGRKVNDKYSLRIYSFPVGQQLSEADIENFHFSASSKANTLTVWPLKDFAVGLMDATTGKVLTASKMDGIDAWGDYALTEDAGGGFALLHAGESTLRHIPVDVGPLPPLPHGTFSRDGKFLSVSLKNRAGIWDLDSGRQIGLIRPYNSAWIDDQDSLIGQFPKYAKWEAEDLRFTLQPALHATELGKLEDHTWQYRNLQLHYKPMGRGKDIARHATLEVKKMDSQTTSWSRDFNEETPALWPAEDDRLVLAWDLSNFAVKNEVKAHQELQKEMDALKGHKKGLLLETVSSETGSPLKQVIVPEPDLTNGSDDVRRATISGDVVLVRGEHENTAIYKLDDGSKVGEFFGHPIATDAGLHLVAAVNRENEILLVDEASGKELKRFTLNSPVRLARITEVEGGKQLLVLTADQVIHRVSVP